MYLDIQIKYSSLIPENEPSSHDFFFLQKNMGSEGYAVS